MMVFNMIRNYPPNFRHQNGLHVGQLLKYLLNTYLSLAMVNTEPSFKTVLMFIMQNDLEAKSSLHSIQKNF